MDTQTRHILPAERLHHAMLLDHLAAAEDDVHRAGDQFWCALTQVCVDADCDCWRPITDAPGDRPDPIRVTNTVTELIKAHIRLALAERDAEMPVAVAH